MKKRMAILALAIVLCGCSKPLETTISGKNVYSPPSDIERVKFDGHIYLVRGGAMSNLGGICHDPDCHCLIPLERK